MNRKGMQLLRGSSALAQRHRRKREPRRERKAAAKLRFEAGKTQTQASLNTSASTSHRRRTGKQMGRWRVARRSTLL